MRNGFTLPIHGFGSRIGCPVAGLMLGCQCPGAEFDTHWEGPNRPSPCLAAIIASAAAFPAATPWALDGESGTAPSDEACCDARACSTLSLLGKAMRAGTVDTMSTRTVYAAVATAASFE